MSAELTDEQVERAMIRLNGSVTVKAGWRVYRAAMREAISEALATPPPEPDDRVEAAYWDGRSDERKRWEPQGTPHTPEQTGATNDPALNLLREIDAAREKMASAEGDCEDPLTVIRRHLDANSPSEPAHGDALARKLEAIAYAEPGQIEMDSSQVAVDKHYWYHVQNTAMAASRHLAASGVPYVPESIRELPDYFDGMSQQLPQSPGSAQAWAQAAHMLRTALASAPADGGKLVPVEPTEEMLDVTVVDAGEPSAVSGVRQRHREVYRAMIAAAPQRGGE